MSSTRRTATPGWEAWQREPRGAPRVAVVFRRSRSPASPRRRPSRSRGATTRTPGRTQRRAFPAAGEKVARRRLARFLSTAAADYAVDRDRPDRERTSRLSPYLRFGAISVRRCFSEGLRAAEAEPRARVGIRKWLDELVWREFYHAVLAHSPHVLTRSFRPEYDRLAWLDDDEAFEAWKAGAPVIPSSTPACVSSGRRAGCTTGRAWSSRAS
jgi:deoxyribodipyrimidine photo-lyase